MNLRQLCKLLGLIAILIGPMVFSLPALSKVGGYANAAAWPDWPGRSPCVWPWACVVAAQLRWGQLSPEAMAVVALSWIMATVLGGCPTVQRHARAPRTPMSLVDAMFESQSGFSTTGATVLAELEDEWSPLHPLAISTHYLGGLGIIVLFVAILGQGSAGKALMRAEMPGPSHSSPQARTQHTAWVLFLIYNGLNAALVLALWMQRVPLFDAICHAFGVIATGGFSTYNASVGHFATDPRLNSVIIELTIVVFMIVAGTNFMLLYWLLVRKPGKLVRDVEWRTYLAILAGATLLVLVAGLVHGDFDRYGTSEAAIEGPVRPTDPIR